MKVKADRDESSPYAAMLAAQDVATRCKELGITALHVKIRATGGKYRAPSSSARSVQYFSTDHTVLRQRHQDPRSRCPVRSPRPRPFRHEDWPYRGRDPNPIRQHSEKGWSPRSSSVSAWHIILQQAVFTYRLCGGNGYDSTAEKDEKHLLDVTLPRRTALCLVSIVCFYSHAFLKAMQKF